MPATLIPAEVVTSTMPWKCIDCRASFQGPADRSPANGCPRCQSRHVIDINVTPFVRKLPPPPPPMKTIAMKPLGADAIAAVLTAAATNHITPVDPVTLMDPLRALEDHRLRARLASLACHRLHFGHGQRVVRIARALRLDPSTVRGRIEVAAKLITKSPWCETYATLP